MLCVHKHNVNEGAHRITVSNLGEASGADAFEHFKDCGHIHHVSNKSSKGMLRILFTDGMACV